MKRHTIFRMKCQLFELPTNRLDPVCKRLICDQLFTDMTIMFLSEERNIVLQKVVAVVISSNLNSKFERRKLRLLIGTLCPHQISCKSVLRLCSGGERGPTGISVETLLMKTEDLRLPVCMCKMRMYCSGCFPWACV